MTTPEQNVPVRDAAHGDEEGSRQRAIAERLLLAALREQDIARKAVETSRHATFLAAASRKLAMSLDQDATREIIQRLGLPRDGAWCILDVVESSGAIHRLTVVHPDPRKQALASTLEDHWNPAADDPGGAPGVTPNSDGQPVVITQDSGAELLAAVHGPQNLAILRTLGFGAMLVVPLVVRSTVLGAITFVTREDDAPFSPEEITLATDLADRCAMALDNARLYREADVLRESADVANRAKSDFLGNMSHELRTPLNVIGGYADLIEMGLHGPVTEEQQDDLKRIKASQLHLLTLITQILNFVQTEGRLTEDRFSEVRVQDALTEAAEMLEGAIKERKLTLDRRWEDVDTMVWADEDRLRQILMNLLTNAVKYTAVGGGKITLSLTVKGDVVIIQVADVGPGIPSEKFEAIFEPFVQLAGGRTSRQGGVGLGLAISRELARGMNGDLTVESTVGVGSRFTLTLPRATTSPLSPGLI